MTQAVAERVKVDAKALIDELLSALQTVLVARVEDFYSVYATMEIANHVKDSPELTQEQRTAVAGITTKIEGHPTYKDMLSQSRNDPNFGIKMEALRKYNRHMKELEMVEQGNSPRENKARRRRTLFSNCIYGFHVSASGRRISAKRTKSRLAHSGGWGNKNVAFACRL